MNAPIRVPLRTNPSTIATFCGDGVNCWWMQIVPTNQYVDPVSFPGYLEGYNGPNTHVWQELWVR